DGAAPGSGTASSQALPDAHALPPAGPHDSIGAPAPPPLATLPTSTARVRERAAILSEALPTTAGSDGRGASPAPTATPLRPARQGARRAAAPAGFAKRGAYLHRPAGPVRVAAGRLPLHFGATAAGTAFASSGHTAPGPVGVLLAAIALCGAGCLRIAAIRTRRGSRASHQGRLTSE